MAKSKKVKNSGQYQKMKIAEAKAKAAKVENNPKNVQDSEFVRMSISEAKERVIEMLDQSYYDRIKGVLNNSQWRAAIERASIGNVLVKTGINVFYNNPEHLKLNVKDWYINILRILHNMMIAKNIDNHTQMLSYILMDEDIISSDERIMEVSKLLVR